MVEQVLEPGDLLYLPTGTWHGPRAIGRSLALTWACHPLSFGQFVLGALRSQLTRPTVPAGLTTGLSEAAPEQVAVYMKRELEQLRELVGDLTVEDLCRHWRTLACPSPEVPDALVDHLIKSGVIGQ